MKESNLRIFCLKWWCVNKGSESFERFPSDLEEIFATTYYSFTQEYMEILGISENIGIKYEEKFLKRIAII